MRTSLVISMVLHAALIALALYPWPRPKLEISPEAPPILVETFEIAEETNIAAAAPEPAPPPPPEPPAPQPEATPPPPEPEPEPPPPPAPQPEEQQAALPPRPEPEPEPEPEPKKEPEPKVPPPPKLRSSSEPPSPKPPERKVPERKAPEPKLPPPKELANEKPKEKSKEKTPPSKVAEKPKPEPAKKKDSDFDLDKILGKTKALAQNEEKRTPERSAAQSAQPRAAVGRGTKMTANEIDALRGMISKCWNIPAGAPRPEELVVKLKLYLNSDGTVAREPELLDTARLASGDPYFRSAAEAAMRAVRVCAPYALPADKFDDWSEITINFRPPY